MKSLLISCLLYVALIANLNAQDIFKQIVSKDENGYSVGTLSGSLSVSPGGAANYTVPIELPEGRMGMTPQLALTYNSQGEYGLLGKGWSIAGWSYIARTGQSLYYDDKQSSVNFAGDGFTIDGARMIKTSEYEAGKTFYRTETDALAKIVHIGAEEKGNRDASWFEVYTKDGLIKTYGGTPDSRQVYNDIAYPAIRYHLNRIEDNKGNYVEYTYERIIENGEVRLKLISYTGNTQISGDAGKPFYTVEFLYNSTQLTQDNILTSYFNKGNDLYAYKVTSLLKEIRLSYIGSEIKKYEIGYKNEGNFSYPYLTEIKLHAGIEKMNPLAFAWNHPVNNIINPQYYRKDDYTVPASYDQNVYLNEDLNFDGKDEVIEVGNFGMRNGQNVSGTFIRLGNNYDVFYKISDYTGKDVHIIDFNGDGEKEIFVDGEVFNFYFGSNNQSVSLIKKLDRPITSGEFKIKHVGDFNGDGIQDIIVKQLGTYFVYFGDANMGYNSRYQIDNYSVVSGALACVEGDFIGKGTTNFCILKTSTSSSDLVIETLELELLSGTDKYSFASKSTQNNLLNGLSQLDGFTSGDFNGDGKTDVLVAYKENSSTRTKILYSYGKGFEQQEISTPLFGMFSQWGSHRVLDLNNDGISDLVFYRSLKVFEQSKWNYKLQMNKYIKKPGVSGSFVVEEVSISSKFILNQNYLEEIEDDGLLLGDFSGNGNYSCFRSFHFFNDAQPPIYAGRCSEIFSSDSGIPPIDAISSITDGFGKTEMISYKKFVPGLAKTTFPVTNFNQSFFVVDQVFADLGKPVAVQKYSYRNMLAHAQGKGLLGFEYTGVTDLINNTYSEVRNEIYNSSETGNAGRLIILPFPAKAITTYLAETPVNNKKMSESSSQIDVFRTRFDSNSPQSKENLIHIPLVTLSVSQSWDIDDNNTYMGCNVQVQKKEDFDVFGNLKKTVSYADESKSTNFPGQESDYSWVEIVETKYVTPDQNDQAKWIISRPEKITAISKHYPKSGDCKQPEVYTSVTEFEYYKHNEAHYPLLHYKWELPSGNENLTTTAEFDYDVFGNVIKKTITTPVEAGVENIKITDYIYNPDATHRGRFLTTEKVNAGSVGDAMVTTYEYSASTGLLKSKTDINGLVTSYGYDAFGKNNLTTMPDGTSVATLIGWSNASEDAPESALYYIAKVRFVPNWTMVWDKEIVFFDKLQRTLRSVSWNLSSKAVYSDKEYDEFGRVSQVSEPYFKNSEPSLFTTYQYDRAGRNYSITTPTGAKILTETKGRVTKVTNMITENWTEKEVNIKGKPLKINDKTNGNIEFCYDAAGRETSIKKYGIITSFEYDDFGNRTVIDDPDAGVTVTEYNKQNQIKYSTDARKNKLEFKHDYLGRLEYRINFTDNDKVEYKYYDKSAENGFGKLKSITKTDLSNGAQIHKTEFSYDNLERIIERKEHIDNEIFTFTYNYNGKTGELEYYQYPSGYRIQYFYNNEGYMHVVKDVTTNKILWSALDNNARGQLTDVALGNGLLTNYQFDAYGFPRRITTTDFNNKHLIKPYSDNAESWPEAETETIQDNSYIFDIHNGNLTKKWELYANNAWFCEAYEYDGVLKERLKKWYKYPGGVEYNIEYSNNGNINSKTGITVPGGSYVYGTNAGPHAVTGITGATQDYIGLIGNNPQTVLYNGINMPYYINQMAQTGGFKMDRIKITYGNGDQRVKTEFSTVYEHYIETDTRYYFGDFEVEKKYNTNKKVYYHYLAGTNGVFAIMKSDGIEDNSIYYIHTDYLGSFQVISDQYGDKIQQLSFDPWGRRRNPADGTFTNLPTTFLFSRGFTGHEHYDKFGLINMNARLYDPFLGRFLSPDPQVQAPDYGQNYNRYTYALNNPLKYTDPDGEFFHLVFGAMIGGFLNVAMNAHKVDNFWQALGYFGIGAVSGALGAGVGAGISSALAGGAFGAGFLGTEAAKIAATSFISGSLIGAGAGATNGFVSGFGNNLVEGNKFLSSLGNGITQSVIQGVTGAIFGGIIGGIDAARNGYDFWDGGLTLDTEGYDVYLASLEGSASPPPNPGKINYGTSKEGKVANHFVKWIKYENMYGDQVLDLHDAFDNIIGNTTLFGRGGEGFATRALTLHVEDKSFKIMLEFAFRQKTGFNTLIRSTFLTGGGTTHDPFPFDGIIFRRCSVGMSKEGGAWHWSSDVNFFDYFARFLGQRR